VTADGISETVGTLLAWLSTAESYLSEAKSVLGDVETVGVLMQQHQACTALCSPVLLLDLVSVHIDFDSSY